MKTVYFKVLFFFFSFFFFLSCSTNDPQPLNQYLKTAELAQTFSKDAFLTKLDASFGPQASQLRLFVRSGIKIYKVSYLTKDFKGEEITASGVLVVPTDLPEAQGLGAIYHGTIFNETDAPSYLKFETEFGLGAFLASTGIYIAMPDYLGYGASKNSPHPYEHREASAKGNVDFLLAIKELIKNEKLNWNNNLVMAGYSQGGFTTMATHKYIQEFHSNDFNLKASSCGAGAYSKTETVRSFLRDKTSGEAANNRSYIWVLLTYDKFYGINRPLSSYFIEPYLSEISKNGYLALIPKSFDEILNPQFIKGIMDGTDTQWINAIKDNDVYDWKPNVPVRLYHGDADTYVPFLNSKIAFETMKANNASDVTLIPIVGGTHGSSVGTFFLGTFELFNKYKN
jgi:pimeloyl-ACP methyl ester carboxylesterase